MEFFTEMFARQRRLDNTRRRAAIILGDVAATAECSRILVKPADFPRIARRAEIR